MHQQFIYFSELLFSGLKFLVPIMFLIKIFQRTTSRINFRIIALSLNLWILVGGTLFLISILLDLFNAAFSEDQDKWLFMLGMITGHHWFQFIIPLFGYAILPQILWFKKLRQTIFSSILIVVAWFASYYLVIYLTKMEGSMVTIADLSIPELLNDYGMKIIAVAFLVIVTYWIFFRKKFKLAE